MLPAFYILVFMVLNIFSFFSIKLSVDHCFCWRDFSSYRMYSLKVDFSSIIRNEKNNNSNLIKYELFKDKKFLKFVLDYFYAINTLGQILEKNELT